MEPPIRNPVMFMAAALGADRKLSPLPKDFRHSLGVVVAFGKSKTAGTCHWDRWPERQLQVTFAHDSGGFTPIGGQGPSGSLSNTTNLNLWQTFLGLTFGPYEYFRFYGPRTLSRPLCSSAAVCKQPQHVNEEESLWADKNVIDKNKWVAHGAVLCWPVDSIEGLMTTYTVTGLWRDTKRSKIPC